MDRPDVAGRVEILKVHARGKSLSKDVDLDKIARRTPGFTGERGVLLYLVEVSLSTPVASNLCGSAEHGRSTDLHASTATALSLR